MTTTQFLGYLNFRRVIENYIYLNSPKGYNRKIINVQTDPNIHQIDLVLIYR